MWRQEFLTDCSDPPACWTQLEMAKLLSADRKLFYKFEGFGHFGGDIGKRASALAAAGLGPEYLGNESGFGIYRVNRGRRLKARDLSPLLLRHLAAYCAFRMREFKADDSQPSAIDEMAPLELVVGIWGIRAMHRSLARLRSNTGSSATHT